MRLEELYPYWSYTHQQLLDTLEYLTDAQLDYRPYPQAESIQDIVLRFIRDERFWIGALVAGYTEYRPVEKEHRTTGTLVEALTVTREITERVLEPYSLPGLRAVRTVPADPIRNHPETNMPISRLLWQVVESELATLGQIMLRLQDCKLTAPPRDARRN
jgi:hypothetical protein